MRDAEAKVRALHSAIDEAMGEVLKVDRSGIGVEKYCDGFTELLAAIAAAARRRKHGRAILEAAINGGVPDRHKGIEAGFVASVE